LEKIAALARSGGVITTVDSTFATPIIAVRQSGAIDLVAAFGDKIFWRTFRPDLRHRDWAARFDRANSSTRAPRSGGCMDPHAAFLLAARSRRWPSGFERQNESACELPSF